MAYRLDLNALATHLRSYGLTVKIEPGAKGRTTRDDQGRTHWPSKPVTILVHHTATPASAQGDYPSMNVVRDGRTGLKGPLAQIGLARSGTVHLIGDGLAWHAGKVSTPAYDNWHSIGIEAEHSGMPAEPWNKNMYDAYARLCAGLCSFLDIPASRVLGHKEVCAPRGRKIDPLFDMPTFRKAVVAAEKKKAAKPAPAKPAPAKPKPSKPKTQRVLKLGDKGEDVRRLQQGMQRVFPTYAPKVADGSYGYGTQRAVREFQSRAGIEVDGICGPGCRKALASYGVTF